MSFSVFANQLQWITANLLRSLPTTVARCVHAQHADVGESRKLERVPRVQAQQWEHHTTHHKAMQRRRLPSSHSDSLVVVAVPHIRYLAVGIWHEGASFNIARKTNVPQRERGGEGGWQSSRFCSGGLGVWYNPFHLSRGATEFLEAQRQTFLQPMFWVPFAFFFPTGRKPPGDCALAPLPFCTAACKTAQLSFIVVVTNRSP